MLKCLLLTSILCVNLFVSKGEELNIFTNKDSSFAVKDYLKIFNDIGKPLSIQQLMDLDAGHWSSIIDIEEEKFTQAEILWIKLDVNSDVVLSNYIIHLPDIKIAEAWLVENGKIKSNQKGGEFVEASSKSILANRKNFIIELDEIASPKFTLYVKLINIKKSQIHLDWYITPYKSWMGTYYLYTIKEIVFQSVLWILIVIALLLFIFMLDFNYFNYAIYLISVSIYFLWDFGFTGNYILGSFPSINFSLKVFQNLAPITYLFFIRNYINYCYLGSWLCKSFIAIILTNICFVFVEVIWLHFTMDKVMLFSNIAYGLSTFSMIYFSISFLKMKYESISEKRILNAGILTILISYILSLFSNFLGLKNTELIMQIGILVEISFFALSLALKIKHNEREKVTAQKELILELKKNKLMQENYNKELETTVAERTTQLKAKNDEILEHRNILLQNAQQFQELNAEILAQAEMIQNSNENLHKNEKILRKSYDSLKKSQEEVNLKNEEIQKINKNLEKLVEVRSKDVVDAKQELDEFLYRSSHNLKGPVSRIKGLLQLLEMDLDNTVNANEYLSKLKEVIMKMERILEKLNDVSVINIGGNNKDINTDVPFILSTIVCSFSNVINAKNIEVIEDTIPVTLNIEPNILTIIIKNLFENAIHFNDSSRPHKIIVKLSKNSFGFIELSIKDNGIGIDSENIKQIFDLFYVGSVTSNGDGMGLYIVLKAVSSIGAFIRVESKKNEGSRFIVTFPVKSKIKLENQYTQIDAN